LNETAFHYGCREGAVAIVDYYLFVLKSDVDMVTTEGWTPVFYAILNNHQHILMSLLEKKASLQQCDLVTLLLDYRKYLNHLVAQNAVALGCEILHDPNCEASFGGRSKSRCREWR
jgi:ankyrin repeat protein